MPRGCALELAGRIREALAQAPDELEVAPTVSVGVATWPQDGAVDGELLDAADRALYVAKRQGGDQAVAYDASMRAATQPG